MTERRGQYPRKTADEDAEELSFKQEEQAPSLDQPSNNPYRNLLQIITTSQTTIGTPIDINPIPTTEPGTVLPMPTWSGFTDPELHTPPAALVGRVSDTEGKVLPTPTWSPLTDCESPTQDQIPAAPPTSLVMSP